MLFATLLLFVGALILGVVLFMSLRRLGIEDARTEARLHAPDAHTVTCVVPAGQDPVILRTALARSGFVSTIETRSQESLLVECEPTDLPRVREIVEHAHPAGLAAAEIQLGHAGFGGA
jgi:hypothetical protein